MGKIKILIVEDESLVAMLLKQKLSRAGFEVGEPVATGEKAVERVKKENPDVVLMDIGLMGDIDGIEAARQIGAFSAASIMFTTGYTQPDLKERAMQLNPKAYLNKPVNEDDLIQIIHAATSSEDARAD